MQGRHENNSDDGLRPCLELEELNRSGDQNLYRHLVKLGRIYKAYPALRTGSYQTVIVRNRQLLFRKDWDGRTVYVALNLEDCDYHLNFGTHLGSLVDVISGTPVQLDNGNAYIKMPPFSAMILVEDDIVNNMEPVEQAAPEEPTQVVVGARYRCIEGGEYEVLAVARHTETNEELVIYRNCADQTVLARPKATFCDFVEQGRRFTMLEG